MTGLLKFIFIFLLIFYGLKLITRFVVPFFAKRYMKKMQKDLYNQQHQRSNKKANEGDVIIESHPKNGKKFDKDVGEYIDYEEIKGDDKE